MTKICDFPYSIYDLTKNLIPYFEKGFCCLYFLAYKAAGGEEGKARMEGGGHDKEVASSKKVHSRLQCKNRYPIYDQNGGKIGKIETQFMTKTAEKPYPLRAAHTYVAHIREYPPGADFRVYCLIVSWLTIAKSQNSGWHLGDIRPVGPTFTIFSSSVE